MSITTFRKFEPLNELNIQHLDYLFYLDVYDETTRISDHFIPNGRFEMIVDLGDRVRVQLDDGSWVRRPRISIAGHHAKGIHVECEGSRFQAIGAVISMGKLSTLIPDPNKRQYGRVIDIDELFPGSSTNLLNDLNSLYSVRHKVRLLDEFISEKIAGEGSQPAFLDHSLEMIYQYKGQITVRDLSAKVHCSTRHLRRSFLHHFGITPKIYSSIIRLHETAAQISRGKRAMADIISDNGYFDRAHFYKEFTRIVGLPPSEYFKRKRILSRNFFNLNHHLNKNVSPVVVAR